MTATTLLCRPAYEGVNIRTWVGFKHFAYLVEQAVLHWLREQGCGARELYHRHGLGFGIRDCSLQLPAVLELDDEVHAEVTPAGGNRLAVVLRVVRGGVPTVVCRARVSAVLVPEPDAPAHAPVPPALAPLVPAEPAGPPGHPPAGAGAVPLRGRAPRAVLAARPGAFVWSWRARYFHCQFSHRVQHSAFVRALEEVVDRFLADRGISVGRLLAERAWIPVVSRARIRLLAPVGMEETVHTVFTVTDILRGVMFEARMDCHLQRGDELVPVAVGTVLHGYAIAAGPDSGTMATLDPVVLKALTGEPGP